MKIDLDSNITKNFVWRECLFLPTWNVHCFPATPEIKYNIIKTVKKLEEVREFLGVPIYISNLYRPPIYNIIVGGSKRSRHLEARAVDIIPRGMDVNFAKKRLADNCKELGVGIEDNGDGLWIHVDLDPSVIGRFFKP